MSILVFDWPRKPVFELPEFGFVLSRDLQTASISGPDRYGSSTSCSWIPDLVGSVDKTDIRTSLFSFSTAGCWLGLFMQAAGTLLAVDWLGLVTGIFGGDCIDTLICFGWVFPLGGGTTPEILWIILRPRSRIPVNRWKSEGSTEGWITWWIWTCHDININRRRKLFWNLFIGLLLFVLLSSVILIKSCFLIFGFLPIIETLFKSGGVKWSQIEKVSTGCKWTVLNGIRRSFASKCGR